MKLDLSNEKVWKEQLEKDSKLKELAVKAGVENDPKRAEELHYCFAWNCGLDVAKTEEEQKLAQYLFCLSDEADYESAIQGRILAARRARISINDL